MFRRCAAEALGTFFLVLIGPGAVMADAVSNGAITHVGVALAFGAVVTAMVFALGHLSGAHINPAVTIAFWSVRRFPARAVAPYIAAQCAGAIAASAMSRVLLGNVGRMGATVPAPALGIHEGGALVIEGLLSFVLMFVIMAVATDERIAEGFAAISIGLTVGFCALVGGPFTGASMNPARSLGPAVVGGVWDAHWVYWVAPIAAMVVAAACYEYLRAAVTPGHDASGGPALGLEGPIERL